MAKKNDRIVYKNSEGEWVQKKVDAERVSGKYKTQKDAEQAARQTLKNQGGGELITKGLDGKIRSKDTIAPGNDPFPPRDTEN